MKFFGFIGIFLLCLALKFVFRAPVKILLSDETPNPEKEPSSPPLAVIISTPDPVDNTPVLADTMLEDYASPDSSNAQDHNSMVRFLDSVFLLVKTRDTADYATNEDLALFLLGQNSNQTPFIKKNTAALNEHNQVIDRWGTPIIIHPVSRKLLEIRFAGPDLTPYTEDDLIWPSK